VNRESDHSNAGECDQDEEVREIAGMIVETAVRALMETSNLDRETALLLLRIAATNCR